MENIKDCRHKLLDSGDEHMLKWLIGKILQYNIDLKFRIET